MPADERRVGNPLAVIIDVRQLALRCLAKAGDVGSVSKARHFQQHFNLGDERARVRQTKGRPECVEGDHRSVLETVFKKPRALWPSLRGAWDWGIACRALRVGASSRREDRLDKNSFPG